LEATRWKAAFPPVIPNKGPRMRHLAFGYPGLAAFDVYGPGTLPAANAP